MNSRRTGSSILKSEIISSISLRMIPSFVFGTRKLKLKKRLGVLKKRKRKLYLSLVHASAAKRNLQQRSNRIVVTFAHCKDAKIASIRNILTPNPLIRRVECVTWDVFAEFAKLSSISNKYE
jgi:hypothetical protein